MSNERIAAVILAAGSSSRMGGIKKEYLKLPCAGGLAAGSGVTVLESSVRTFASFPCISTVVIAVCENGEDQARNALSSDFFPARETLPEEPPKPNIIFVTGGKTRRSSVFNALSALVSFNPRYVLIHDGARPYISASLIENLLAAVKKYDAVIPVLPLIDTPKELGTLNEEYAAGDNEQMMFIKRHLRRAEVGSAQTPQAFLFPEIFHAHEEAARGGGEEFTDDAEIWGRFCGKVAVIPGDPANKKITFKEDLY